MDVEKIVDFLVVDLDKIDLKYIIIKYSIKISQVFSDTIKLNIKEDGRGYMRKRGERERERENNNNKRDGSTDLHHRNFELIHRVSSMLALQAEELSNNVVVHTRGAGVAFHRERLSTPRLTVGKDAHVVPL